MSRSNINRLNPQQKNAVRHIESPLLVLAGAGSGKTSVITQKIAWLVNDAGYPPEQIAALTFTNKAAREMQTRVKGLLPSKGRAPKISTFHQLGLGFLHAHSQQAGRQRGFSILDETDASALLRDIMIDDGTSDDTLLKLLQQRISNWKSECIAPEKVSEAAKSNQEKRWALIYDRYQSALQSYNAVDFDDLISLPVSLLRRDEKIRQQWRQQVRYLLVDEYQDTNIAQYELIKQLIGDRSCLCVVGDDDQSIYTWRGANPENLTQLSQDFRDLKVIKLEQNYRSTNTILKSANQLIGNNSHMFEKKLWSEKGMGDPIAVQQLADEESEVEFACNQITVKRLNYRCHYSDFAILVRSNFQAKLLEMKLQQQQIPYHLTGGTSFFSRHEIKDILAYLRLIVNPDDDSAFLRIINTPRRKIGIQTLEALGQYAQQRKSSLFSCIEELGLSQTLSPSALERLQRFGQWLVSIKQRLEKDDSILEVLNEMLADIDYQGWLAQNASSPAIADKRMQNVRFLLDSIQREAKKIKDEEERTSHDVILERVINKLLLRDLLDQQSEEEANNKVQIMTLHAAKGLEFPHVLIIGFEENILPHKNSIEADSIEEERRLAYVGITRAQRTLTLSMAKKRKQFGESLNCKPSRFLDELPAELLRKTGFETDDSAADNQVQGAETLANLKALFD